MDINLHFAILPYAASFIITLAIGLEAWQRKDSSARAYTGVALSQALWTFGYIFELLSPTIEGKIFWDNFQFIGGFGWSLSFLLFTLRYTYRRFTKPLVSYLLLSLPGILMVLLAYTDPMHRLVRPDAILVPGVPFSALLYEITPVFWVWAIFGYGLGVACVALLVDKFIDTQPLYRIQVGLIVLGNAIPLIGTFLTMTGLITIPLRDITPLTFPIGNIFVALGLFQYRLFDVKPIAHHIIIENMRDAVFILDKERRVVDLNRAALESMGQDERHIIGQPMATVFSAWPELLAQYPTLIKQPQAEIEVPMTDGLHYIELTIQPLQSRYGRHLGQVVIARNVTQQKTAVAALQQRTAELEQANQQLRHLSEIKDRFVAHVSHELRTPITSLKLHQTLLRRNPKKQMAYLGIMERETARLGNLIEDILTLSRFDQNQQPLTVESLDVLALLDRYIEDRRPLAARKEITLRFEHPQAFPALLAHKNFLEQAIGILLTNAINYTPSGGQICVALHRVEEAEQAWAQFSVQDNGFGIALEDQKQLFTRFFRGAAGRQSGVPGTGLGLVIAKEIVERHNGRLHIHSTGVPGEGTAVSILLPLAQPQPVQFAP